MPLAQAGPATLLEYMMSNDGANVAQVHQTDANS
jgi:hypothetical protein